MSNTVLFQNPSDLKKISTAHYAQLHLGVLLLVERTLAESTRLVDLPLAPTDIPRESSCAMGILVRQLS